VDSNIKQLALGEIIEKESFAVVTATRTAREKRQTKPGSTGFVSFLAKRQAVFPYGLPEGALPRAALRQQLRRMKIISVRE
jgi:hypothetical protein